MISVLIPSRGRTKPLGYSVKSLLRLASDPSSIEILVAADPDDQETADTAKELGVILHVAPHRYGYPGLHHYYNYLASQAKGEWVFVFNDDTRMRTPGWDDIVHQCPPAILYPYIDHIPEHNSFPLIPAHWAKLLGHLSPSEGVDAVDTGRRQDHRDHPEDPGANPSCAHHGRSTAIERDARDVQAELASFNSEEASQARLADAMKLQAFLGGPPLDPMIPLFRITSLRQDDRVAQDGLA